jgi:CRP-like cAMP-binding protein
MTAQSSSMLQSILQALNICSAFTSLTLAEKKQLAAHGALRNYAVDEEVFSTEQAGDAFYLVASGKLFLRLRNRDRKFYQAGELFGEVSIFDNRTRTGTVKATEPAQLVCFNKDLLFEPNQLDTALQLKIIKLISRHMVAYFYKEAPLNARELIRKGESETVEFKKSADKQQHLKIVETIAAMANAKGGAILLGVEDDGRPVGVKKGPTFKDVFALNIEALAKQRLGKIATTLFHVDSEVVDHARLLRIDVDASSAPLIYSDVQTGHLEEVLWVRTNNENTAIRSLTDCIRYVEKRFKPET